MKETPVYVCFVATKEWWAKVMRWLLRSQFNHIFILFMDDTWIQWQVVDITKDGVRVLPASASFSRVKTAECWEYKRSLIEGLRSSASLIGSKYDWYGLVVNIFRLIVWKMFGVQWRTPLHDLTRWMCFEFAINMMQMSGVKGSLRLEPSVTPPEELRAFMKEHGFKTIQCPIATESDAFS